MVTGRQSLGVSRCDAHMVSALFLGAQNWAVLGNALKAASFVCVCGQRRPAMPLRQFPGGFFLLRHNEAAASEHHHCASVDSIGLRH